MRLTTIYLQWSHMKHVTILLLSCFSLFTSTCQGFFPSEEQNPTICQETKEYSPYVKLVGGVDFFNMHKCGTKASQGYYLGGAIGCKLTKDIRVEAEGSYQKISSSHDRERSWSFMANCLMDIDVKLPVVPYFGVGIGYAEIKNNWYSSSESVDARWFYKKTNHAFAQQAILGLKYPVDDQLDLGLEYRFSAYGKNGNDQKIGLALIRSF